MCSCWSAVAACIPVLRSEIAVDLGHDAWAAAMVPLCSTAQRRESHTLRSRARRGLAGACMAVESASDAGKSSQRAWSRSLALPGHMRPGSQQSCAKQHRPRPGAKIGVALPLPQRAFVGRLETSVSSPPPVSSHPSSNIIKLDSARPLCTLTLPPFSPPATAGPRYPLRTLLLPHI